MYNNTIKDIEHDSIKIIEMIKDFGEKIKLQLGLDWPYLDPSQSKYTLDLYNETINLGLTYYRINTDV